MAEIKGTDPDVLIYAVKPMHVLRSREKSERSRKLPGFLESKGWQRVCRQ